MSPFSPALSSKSSERGIATTSPDGDDDNNSDTGSILFTFPKPSLPKYPSLGRLLPRTSSASLRGMDRMDLGRKARLIQEKITPKSVGSSARDAFRMTSTNSSKHSGAGGFAETEAERLLLRYEPERARGRSFLALLQNSWRKYVAEMRTVRASLFARRRVLGRDEPRLFFRWFKDVFAFTRCWVQMLGRLFSGDTLLVVVGNRKRLNMASAWSFESPAELQEILTQASEVMKMERLFQMPSRQSVEDVTRLCEMLEKLAATISEYLENQMEALLPVVDEIIVDDEVLPCFMKWILQFIATRADPVFLTHAFASWSNEKYLRQEVAELFADPFCEFERANEPI